MRGRFALSRRLFDHDPLTGLRVWWDYDADEDRGLLTYEQDVTPHLDACADARNAASGPMGDMAHVASIPIGVQYEWLTKHGVNMWDKNHAPAVKRLLNGDYRYLKVRNVII